MNHRQRLLDAERCQNTALCLLQWANQLSDGEQKNKLLDDVMHQLKQAQTLLSNSDQELGG